MALTRIIDDKTDDLAILQTRLGITIDIEVVKQDNLRDGKSFDNDLVKSLSRVHDIKACKNVLERVIEDLETTLLDSGEYSESEAIEIVKSALFAL